MPIKGVQASEPLYLGFFFFFFSFTSLECTPCSILRMEHVKPESWATLSAFRPKLVIDLQLTVLWSHFRQTGLSGFARLLHPKYNSVLKLLGSGAGWFLRYY